jgi:hypothetical protein
MRGAIFCNIRPNINDSFLFFFIDLYNLSSC